MINSENELFNEIMNYNCPWVDIRQKYHVLNLFERQFLNIILSEFDSCIEKKIKIVLAEDKRTIIKVDENITKNCVRSTFSIYLISRKIIGGRGHRTIVLVNHMLKEIEYYEPNGLAPVWHEPVELYYENIFMREYPSYKFYRTSSFCPRLGPQKVGKMPWCTAYSLLYILARRFNPTISRQTIVRQMLDYGSMGIPELIGNFICYSYDLIMSSNIKKVNVYMRSQLYDILVLINSITNKTLESRIALHEEDLIVELISGLYGKIALLMKRPEIFMLRYPKIIDELNQLKDIVDTSTINYNNRYMVQRVILKQIKSLDECVLRV